MMKTLVAAALAAICSLPAFAQAQPACQRTLGGEIAAVEAMGGTIVNALPLEAETVDLVLFVAVNGGLFVAFFAGECLTGGPHQVDMLRRPAGERLA